MQTQTSNTLHNAIMEAGSKDRPPILAPGNYVQWKSRIKRYIDTKPNHELIHYCLTNPPYELGIDNDIYSTVDACPIACEMWKAIKRLKQGESINVQDLETNLYWEFGKFTSQDGESLESYYSWFYKMMNEHIRNQCKVTNHQVNVQSQQAATRNRGKAIVNSSQPIDDQEPFMVDDDETSKDKEIDKLMASLYHSRKSTNLPTTTFKLHQTPIVQIRIILQRLTKMLDAVDSGPIFDTKPEQKVQNDDHYDVFAIECQHLEQYESVHETYPIEQDAHNVIIDSMDMNYDSEQIDQNDEDADLSKERELLASLIEKLKCEIDESKNRNKFLETSNKIKLYKTQEDKELKKVIELENKVKVLDNIVYKTGQSVQTMNMLNNKCRTSFVKPEYLKKAKQANPRLYDIGCYNDNLALMLAPESDKVIRLKKESRSKLREVRLADLIDHFTKET
nr:hypothetical protein [Tanacetum cinerariifolium]